MNSNGEIVVSDIDTSNTKNQMRNIRHFMMEDLHL